MNTLIIIACIIGGIYAAWLIFVLLCILMGGIVTVVNHIKVKRRIKRRQAEIRARLQRQGAPFNRLEHRTAIVGLR